MAGTATAAANVIDRTREIAPTVAAAGDEIFRTGRLPAVVIAALEAADLFRVAVPAEFGGLECDPQTFCAVAEILGEADMSTAWCFVQAAASGYGHSPRMSQELGREVFGRPACAAAAGFGTGTAERVSGGFLVSGKWNFASGCLHAAWFDARSSVEGAQRTGQAAQYGFGYSMLVPRSDVEIEESWDVTGMRGTGSSRYIANKVFVPDVRAISLSAPPRSDLSRTYRIPAISTAHLAFASQALGAARGALQDFISLASGKTAAFSKDSLRDEETTQTAIGRCRARLCAATAHRDWALQQLWDGAAEGVPSPELRGDARLAAIGGVDAAIEIIDTVYRISGTTGIFASTALHRRFQDIHVLAQQVVGRPKHYQNVGRLLLGLEYDRLFL